MDGHILRQLPAYGKTAVPTPYSIVAELRSTALRRVTNHVLGHRQATRTPVLSLSAKTRENQRPKPSRSQTSQTGELDKLFHSNDGIAPSGPDVAVRQNARLGASSDLFLEPWPCSPS